MAASDGFAYLLAFLVKWKLLEAFVVPTGAMAPTIYGAHADVVCQNCGMEYAVSMSRWAEMQRGREPVHAACPNCGQPSEIGPHDPVLRGDRILVDKISQPHRWDLITFKYPEDRRVNYVKRVVGMPGETVEIADGDIFVNGSRLCKEPSQSQDMWLFVHDSSRVAKRMLPGSSHWEPEGSSSHWKFGDGQWQFTGMDVTGDAMVFSGRLTDEIAYNEKEPGAGLAENTPPLVGDIKLVCDLKGFSGEGNLELRWEFRGQKVMARISSAGQVEMTMPVTPGTSDEGDGRERVAHGKLQGPLSAVRQLGFAVRDGQAYVMEGNHVVVTAVVGPQDLASVKLRLKEASEPCRLAILGSRCNVTLARVVLWKDIYYRNLSQIPLAGHEAGWGCTGHPIRLGEGEYFVLGDNSSRSKDSRFWGVVPADAVIGVGRWTYWPPGRWHHFQ
ncbi:MAG: signal peptidase I [Thermoguttaceae bacterium]|jgi:signal peptidase I